MTRQPTGNARVCSMCTRVSVLQAQVVAAAEVVQGSFQATFQLSCVASRPSTAHLLTALLQCLVCMWVLTLQILSSRLKAGAVVLPGATDKQTDAGACGQWQTWGHKAEHLLQCFLLRDSSRPN